MVVKKRTEFLYFILLALLVSGLSCGHPYNPKLTIGWKKLKETSLYNRLDTTDTLAGVDLNRNGVRDDIEKWINEQNITDKQRFALMKFAFGVQYILIVNHDEREELIDAADYGARTVGCILASFPDDDLRSKDYMDIIQAATANTKRRASKYLEADEALSNSVYTIKEGDPCEDL